MALTTLALIGRIILLGLERVIVKKMGRDNSSIEVTVLFFGIGAFCLLPFLIGVEIHTLTFLPYTLISSCIYSITFVLYVKALSTGEVSLVTPVASFNVLFLFLLSVLFLNESFNLLKITGILLIFYGSSYLKPGSTPLSSIKAVLREKPCLYMLLSTLLLAVGRIIDKAGSQNVSSILYSFIIYTLISLILYIFLLFKKRSKNLLKIFRDRPKIALLSGATNAFSYLFLLVALKGIEVSIAEPLTLLSTLLAVILGRYFFQEIIRQRLIAASIIIIGSWFLLL
jgi:bacterial/archaeal transporter family protein